MRRWVREESRKYLTVYVSGRCSRELEDWQFQRARAGYGVHVVGADIADVRAGVDGLQTRYHCETRALEHAIRLVRSFGK